MTNGVSRRASALVSFLLVILPFASAAEESRHHQPAPIDLEETLYLPSPSGEYLKFPPGSYRIRTDEKERLRVESSGSDPSQVIQASEITHVENLSVPQVRIRREDAEERSLVLLLPGGQGLLSAGSSTGVKTRMAVPSASVLGVGEWRKVTVVAKTYINWTGIKLIKGQRYRFEVLSPPPFEKGLWIDSGVRTTADGFATCPVDALCAPFRGLRRIPDANWFALSGGLGDPSLLAVDLKHRFVIGDRRTVTAPATGHLGLFANDVSTMYWNNEGAITMKITRTE